MVLTKSALSTGAGRIAIAAVILPLLLLIGCDSPLIDQVAAIRTDAVANAVQASQKDLTAFSIKDPAEIGTISGTSVAVTVPPGTDLTHLVANFAITGISVSVNGVTQTNNSTINDFTSSLGYLVTATDGTTKLYTVTVAIGVTAPILTATAAASGITTTTATSGGTISNNGGAPITASGICWSTAQNPAIGSCAGGGYTTDGTTSPGSWSTSSMTGLATGTTYYVRAYATNSKGTGYGPQVSFLTVPAAPAKATLAAVGGSPGSGELSVSWSAVTGATLYEAYCSTSNVITSASQPTGGTDISSTSCTVSGLTNYTTYYVWIYAKNGTGTSAASPSSNGVVGIPVTSITLQRQADTQTLSGGRTSDNFVYDSRDTLVATVSPSNATNANVTWATTSSTYAAISAGGLSCLVTAGASAGTATITATAQDGQGASAACSVKVTSNAIGQTGPGGGKIILDQGSYTTGTSTSATYGWRYLETAVASTSLNGSWGWSSSTISMSLNTAVGYGPSNTTQLVAAFGGDTSTAGYIAHNYKDSATGGAFTDWFLPSSDEMDTSNWRTYAVLPQYYAAWSSYGASNGNGGYIYSNGSYSLTVGGVQGGVGWVGAMPGANPNGSFLVIRMRRF